MADLFVPAMVLAMITIALGLWVLLRMGR